MRHGFTSGPDTGFLNGGFCGITGSASGSTGPGGDFGGGGGGSSGAGAGSGGNPMEAGGVGGSYTSSSAIAARTKVSRVAGEPT